MNISVFIIFLFFFVNLAILIYFFYKFFVKFKSYEQTLGVLNKNVDLLNVLYNKQYKDNLKNMIELYSEVQTILKISEASFISLFKYDYSKRYITLHFMFSINKHGEIIHESFLNKLPVTSNILNLKILNSNEGIHSITLEEIKDIDKKIYQFIKYRDIEKIYFKNLKINEKSPLGYISFSYNNEYEIDDRQIEEISRISTRISEML